MSSKKQAIDELINGRLTETKVLKKKVSFDFDHEFHEDLKIYAVKKKMSMVDVVVAAVKDYMKDNQ